MSTISDSRRATFQERKKSFLDETILSPGAVRINVQGAFIVDQEPSTTPDQSGAQHDTGDIRLPNHQAVVSHVALDIGGTLAKLVYFSREANSKEVCICQDYLRNLLSYWPLLKNNWFQLAPLMSILKDGS